MNCGIEWGYTDECEAVSHPMTLEERRVWFDERQATSLMIDIIDDVGFGLDQILVWFDELEAADRARDAVEPGGDGTGDIPTPLPPSNGPAGG